METDSLHLFQPLLQQMKLRRLSQTLSARRISCFKVGGFNNRAYLIASVSTSARSPDLPLLHAPLRQLSIGLAFSMTGKRPYEE